MIYWALQYLFHHNFDQQFAIKITVESVLCYFIDNDASPDDRFISMIKSWSVTHPKSSGLIQILGVIDLHPNSGQIIIYTHYSLIELMINMYIEFPNHGCPKLMVKKSANVARVLYLNLYSWTVKDLKFWVRHDELFVYIIYLL